MARVRKSRAFAIVLDQPEYLGFYFLQKVETEDDLPKLILRDHYVPSGLEKDDLIELLKKVGLTVRFYDREEKCWKEVSEDRGVEAVPGPRDGTFGLPQNTQDFDQFFLRLPA